LFGEDYGRKTYKVVGVADGDTIDIEINDKKERVRLMGIDAPETIKPFGAPDCYGRESYEKTKEMLLGKYIVLQSDESTNNNDASKIPLMYAILEDGTDFNKFMIGEGFAYEFSSDKPYKFQKEYKAIEAEAKNMKKGLWGACSA
jgi:micrococcal nuclease